MLVLNRQELQTVWIGDAAVTVVRNRNGKVRLVIEAPDHVPIVRDELFGGGPRPREVYLPTRRYT